MQEYSEVNWSQICRDAITNYINKRLEWIKPTLLKELEEYLTEKGIKHEINANILQDLNSKTRLHINYWDDQTIAHLSEFNQEKWKEELYGQLENVTNFLRKKGYSIGIR